MSLPDPIGQRSERLFRLFALYARFLLTRRFRALRLSGTDPATLPRDRPLILFSNHPSWWDPLLYIVLADLRFRGRPGFGPMEREALGRYGVFSKLGVFGIDKHTVAGARQFLRIARRVLTTCEGPGGRGMLWVTAEGDFNDPRRRPVRLRPGIAHLAASLPEAVLLPVAIEYVFWNESRPELLLRLGPPLEGDGSLRPAQWAKQLEAALTNTMDRLAEDAQARDPARFSRLLLGTAGIGGPYDQWRAWSARLQGRRFVASHEEEHP